jgi:hypothetical protein
MLGICRSILVTLSCVKLGSQEEAREDTYHSWVGMGQCTVVVRGFEYHVCMRHLMASCRKNIRPSCDPRSQDGRKWSCLEICEIMLQFVIGVHVSDIFLKLFEMLCCVGCQEQAGGEVQDREK